MLKQCLALFDQETAAKKGVKETQEALERAVLAQYPQLTEAEIKSLVVDDKWKATLKTAVQAEIERVTQQLANRVKDLEERYAEPLPQLMEEVEARSRQVEAHLQKMGVMWGLEPNGASLPLKIYLDVCCLNRPFDDGPQERVRLEADSVLSIIERIRAGQWQLITREAIAVELAKMCNLEKKARILLTRAGSS